MISFAPRRFTDALTLAFCGLLLSPAVTVACQPGPLVEALAQAGATTSRAPMAAARKPISAAPLQEAELTGLPALARIESLLGRVGLPMAWHRLEASFLEVALEASGGTLVVARPRVAGGEPECEVLTRAHTGTGVERPGESFSQSVDRVRLPQATVLALLPVREAGASDASPWIQDVLRSMLADFRLAMRVGGQYAPKGAWVVSPWLSAAELRRSMDVDSPLPGLRGRSDTRVRVGSAGLGLTRGLTRDTAMTLLLAHQNSRLNTTVTFPAMGPMPAQQFTATGRQEDTLVGLGLYSLLVREHAALPTVLLNARAFAPSTHTRAGGSASLTSLYEIASGWALAASVGVDAERPEAAPSRFGRLATLGASAQLSSRWMVTADAGRRELRGLPGTQSVQRLRLYHSFGSMSYLALVIDREGADRRATVTFAWPW